MTAVQDAMQELAALVDGHRFTYANEYELQDGLSDLLSEQGFEVEREVRLGARDRVDLCCSGIGIEVKIAGNAETLARQIERYLSHDEIEGVIVVTSIMRHAVIPQQINDKPVRIVTLARGSL